MKAEDPLLETHTHRVTHSTLGHSRVHMCSVHRIQIKNCGSGCNPRECGAARGRGGGHGYMGVRLDR